MSESLSRKEEFTKHHSFVKQHIDNALEVGKSLAYIRDEQLYLTAGYGTFEAYCTAEFKFSGRHGYRFIQAADVTEKYDLPNEYTARKMLEVPEDKRDEVAIEAKAIAESQGHAITGTIIQEAAAVVGVQKKRDSESDAVDTQRMRDLLETVRSVGHELGKMRESEAVFVDHSACRAAVETLISHIKPNIPTHRCYSCSGQGCKLCKGLGWMPEALFKTREQAFRGG